MTDAVKPRPQTGNLWQEAWIRFRRNRLAMAGLVMVIFLIVVAVFAPFFAPFDPYKQLIWSEGLKVRLAPPTGTHWMGTDLFGRDIMSRVIFGARISLQIGIFATVVSLLLIAFGVLSFIGLPLRELPDIDPPVVSISTQYVGASADVVQSRVTEMIEDQVAAGKAVLLISSELILR